MDQMEKLTEVMCRYPGAARDSRGPTKPLAEPYVALLDSRVVAAKHATALSDGIESRTGRTCVDLSAPHAGPDAILKDRALLQIAKGADAVVLTVPGAHALSNPYYRVHSWRNDRVIAQQMRLRSLYPEVEFEQHHFVRHLLADLHAVSPGRFVLIRETLRRIWLQRMDALLTEIGKPVVLLWIGDRRPDEEADTLQDGDPPFVTKSMIGSLAVAARSEVIIRPRSALRLKAVGLSGARITPSNAHEVTADQVANCLERLTIRAKPKPKPKYRRRA